MSGQRTGTGTNFDASLPAGDTSGVARRAANGRPSNLTAEQYARASSAGFKARYGDWERLSQKNFLDGKPIVNLTGDEFKKIEGQSLIPRVVDWYAKNFNGAVVSPILGNVELNEKGVSDSLAHGIGRNKAAAFVAVPHVIRQGALLHSALNYEDRKIDRFTIGAPIKIGGHDFVAVVIVQRDVNSQRFYLHEVGLKSRLREEAFKSEALTAQKDALNGASNGAIKTLLRNIYSVNPENIKNFLDENGEPRMSKLSADGDASPNFLRPCQGTPSSTRHLPNVKFIADVRKSQNSSSRVCNFFKAVICSFEKSSNSRPSFPLLASSSICLSQYLLSSLYKNVASSQTSAGVNLLISTLCSSTVISAPYHQITVHSILINQVVKPALLKTPCLRDEYPKAAQMLDAAVRNLNAAYVKINDGNDEARS